MGIVTPAFPELEFTSSVILAIFFAFNVTVVIFITRNMTSIDGFLFIVVLVSFPHALSVILFYFYQK